MLSDRMEYFYNEIEIKDSFGKWQISVFCFTHVCGLIYFAKIFPKINIRFTAANYGGSITTKNHKLLSQHFRP